MATSSNIANEKFTKELEDELMKFTSNYDEKKVQVHSNGKIDKVQKYVDEEVNITECTKSGDHILVKAECTDTTESSSSFDGSDCGVENADALEDNAASSDFCSDDASLLGFHGFGENFEMRKKKKVTAHWRTYIQPLTWRCKWIELQIKKLEDQAKKYEQKLEECCQQKNVQLDESTLESGIKSLPFSHNHARNEVLKRKKRGRIEATDDTAAYMSRHVIFSYYEKNRYLSVGMDYGRMNPEHITPRWNIEGESCGHDEQLLCDKSTKDDKNMEDIYRKITALQSRVGRDRSRVERLMSENADKFAYFDNSMLSSRNNALVSSPPNAADTSNNQRRAPLGPYIASQLMPGYNMNGVPSSESAATHHEPVLLGTNRNMDHVWVPHAYENEDDILISNLRAKEVMHTFEELKVPLTQRPDTTKTLATAEAAVPTGDQPPQNMHFIPKLGGRVDQVTRENDGDFSMLAVQNNALASSPNSGNPMPMDPHIASDLMLEHTMNYAHAFKSLARQHQSVVPNTNRNEDSAYFPSAYGNGGDMLINNPRVKEAPNTSKQVNIQRPDGQPSCGADTQVTTELAQKMHSISKRDMEKFHAMSKVHRRRSGK